MGNQEKFTKKQSCERYRFPYISVLISHLEVETMYMEKPLLEVYKRFSADRVIVAGGRRNFILRLVPNNKS